MTEFFFVLIAFSSPKIQRSINSLIFGKQSLFWARAVLGMLDILGFMSILGYFVLSLPDIKCEEEQHGFQMSQNKV
jgi:hypothetical protein